MSLSPTDFAAYSRATGTPYPESPQERAQIVPQVRAFRAGQLQQGESGGENNLLTGIGIGLGLLGASGVALGARGRRIPKMDLAGKSRVQQRTNPSADQVYTQTPEGTKDLQRLNTNKIEPSKVVTQEQVLTEVPVSQVDFPGTATEGSGFRQFSERADAITGRANASDFLSDRVDELLSEVKVGPAGEMLAGPEVAAEARQMMGTEASRQASFVRRINKEGEKVLDEMRAEPISLTETYEAFGEPAARAQNIDAVQSASDQLDSRVEAVVQRDTDSVRTGKQQRLFRDFGVDTSADLEVAGKQLQDERYSDFPGTATEGSGFRQFSERADAITGRANKVFTAEDLLYTNRRGQIITRGINPEEALDRVNAAASQARGSQAEQLLLNPNVSTTQVRQLGLLGSTPKFDAGTGYVETNPTFELRTGAAASMGDRSGKIKTDTGFETNLGTEGSAYLKETKANKERTNKASTLLAGVVEELQGGAPLSQRRERVKDEFTPIRTIEGEETAGVFIDDDQRLKLVGEGNRRFGKIQSDDMNTQGTRQPGGFEVAATSEISPLITDAPAERPATNQERLVTDRSGRQFVIDSKAVIEGRQPLTGVRGTIKQKKIAGQPGTGIMSFSEDAQSELLSVDRRLSEGLAQAAADTYRNNPSAKKAYLAANNPGALQDVRLLSDAGNALDYKDFVIKSVDTGLKREGIKLDILQPIQTKRGKYYSASTHAFVDGLLKTSKDPEVYVRPLKVGDTGAPVLDYRDRYQGDEKYEAQPMPGNYKETRGTGGVDPMQVGDDYEGNIAYNAPRVEGGRSLTPAESRPVAAPSNPVATGIAETRTKMANFQPSKPRPDSIEDITGPAMTQLLAQANRRRGARRS